MAVKIKVWEENSAEQKCFLSGDIFDSLRLTENTIYNIHAGQRSIRTVIGCAGASNGELYLPKKLQEKLLVYEGQNINVWIKEKDIYLGPVVGVLVSPARIKELKEGRNSKEARMLFEVNKKSNCILYYFTKENIYIKDNIVNGITCLPEKEDFDFLPMPIPQVVYEQLENVSDSEAMAYSFLKNTISNAYNAKYINSRTYLGKWEAFLALSKDIEGKKYLPITISYDSFEDVIFMLNHFDRISLKYVYGIGEEGVLYIENTGDGLTVEYIKEELKKLFFNDIESFEKFVVDFIDNRFFIITEETSVMRLKDQGIILDIMLQKNGQGKWISTGMKSRIGKAVSENICYDLVYQDLKETYGDKLPEKEKIIGNAVKVAECLEKEFGSLGFIQIEAAIDENGRFLIIETNTLPYKAFFSELEINKEVEEKLFNLLEYSKFLTK